MRPSSAGQPYRHSPISFSSAQLRTDHPRHGAFRFVARRDPAVALQVEGALESFDRAVEGLARHRPVRLVRGDDVDQRKCPLDRAHVLGTVRPAGADRSGDLEGRGPSASPPSAASNSAARIRRSVGLPGFAAPSGANPFAFWNAFSPSIIESLATGSAPSAGRSRNPRRCSARLVRNTSSLAIRTLSPTGPDSLKASGHTILRISVFSSKRPGEASAVLRQHPAHRMTARRPCDVLRSRTTVTGLRARGICRFCRGTDAEKDKPAAGLSGRAQIKLVATLYNFPGR